MIAGDGHDMVRPHLHEALVASRGATELPGASKWEVIPESTFLLLLILEVSLLHHACAQHTAALAVREFLMSDSFCRRARLLPYVRTQGFSSCV